MLVKELIKILEPYKEMPVTLADYTSEIIYPRPLIENEIKIVASLNGETFVALIRD